jgi:hypothetical protein
MASLLFSLPFLGKNMANKAEAVLPGGGTPKVQQSRLPVACQSPVPGPHNPVTIQFVSPTLSATGPASSNGSNNWP